MDKNMKDNAGTLVGLHRKSLGKVESRAGDARERIRAMAYAIWEDRVRSGEPGDEVSDWLAAERITVGLRQQRRRK
jgi:hypothetical protein